MKKLLPSGAFLIPDQARRVFKGKIFDIYQWRQRLFDGSEAVFEMAKRPDTVQIVAIKDGQLVMVDDEQPHRSAQIHFPGGRVDSSDESWLAAAKREMREETGLDFKDWKMIAVFQPAPKIEQFVPWFLAQNVLSEAEPHLDPGERIRVKLLDFDDVRSKVVSEGSTMTYGLPLFIHLEKLDDLLEMHEFQGSEAELQ